MRYLEKYGSGDKGLGTRITKTIKEYILRQEVIY